MDKYDQISVVGEGSYGLVMKCRHRESDQLVAIKKFLETEEDATIRKMALREIRMLKRLKHENLVTMIEVFRCRKRFYLVFEFVDGTVLDELEKFPGGLGEDRSREIAFQVTRAISYCHSNNIIHRDVKPENVLVSSLGVVKLCDFGFARIISLNAEACTEYVATRWYRAPELLVGDSNYGAAVDIWAIGCLFAEMMGGDSLFPGESDIDQLFLIVKLLGKPCLKHQHLMCKHLQLRAMIKTPTEPHGLYKNFSHWSLLSIEFLNGCLKMDPLQRLSAEELLKHNYFLHDRFPQKFLPLLREKVNIEFNNPLMRKFKTEILMSTDKKDEIKPRRSFHPQYDRWRFTLAEGSMKRKLSSESLGQENLITLAKTTARLCQVQAKNSQKQSLKSRNDEKNVADLEKSLESLAKLSGNQEELVPPQNSPLEHQTFTKSPLNLKELKPKVNASLTRNQSFLKKLDRAIVVEQMFGPEAHKIENNSWFNVAKRKEPRRTEDFSLPSLPGLVGTPIKARKKPVVDEEPPSVTPRIQSSASQKSPSKILGAFLF